jgi:hypothetical protein
MAARSAAFGGGIAAPRRIKKEVYSTVGGFVGSYKQEMYPIFEFGITDGIRQILVAQRRHPAFEITAKAVGRAGRGTGFAAGALRPAGGRFDVFIKKIPKP